MCALFSPESLPAGAVKGLRNMAATMCATTLLDKEEDKNC